MLFIVIFTLNYCLIFVLLLINFLGLLRQKDEEQAILLEEKMALQLRLLAAAGLDPPSPPPSYRHLVSEQADTGVMWREVLSAVQVSKYFIFIRFLFGNFLSSVFFIVQILQFRK